MEIYNILGKLLVHILITIICIVLYWIITMFIFWTVDEKKATLINLIGAFIGFYIALKYVWF